MQVSFVIPLYNCLGHTRECLRTLQATLPRGLAHEIILVDDGSTDGTREWLATLAAPCRVLLNERNLGFAGACNRGAAAATGEFLFLLNNDLVLPPGWFEPMRAVLAGRPDAGVVGNVQRDAATGAIDHAGVVFNRKGKPEHRRRRPLRALLAGVAPVAAVTGACCALRTATWRRLGGFDEGYVNGGEDIDLCFRARAAGLRNFVAARSTVRHHVSASPGRKRRDEENSRRLMLRWRPEIVPLAARDVAVPCLEASWDEPRDYRDADLARDCFLYRLRLRPDPGPRLRAVVEAALELELTRWREILDGLPAPPGSGIIPAYRPLDRRQHLVL